jgi:DNA-binding transcriptional LysR family regulator
MDLQYSRHLLAVAEKSYFARAAARLKFAGVILRCDQIY